MIVEGIYTDEHLTLDYRRASAAVDTNKMILTRKEFELLAMLTANEGEIVPRGVLLMSIWGYSAEIRTRTLDVHIRRLRKKLGTFGEQYIETVFGVGYRFQRFRAMRTYHNFAPQLFAVGA
jgi:two-component system alkaline phosphatase synthesis response regulator PhoP